MVAANASLSRCRHCSALMASGAVLAALHSTVRWAQHTVVKISLLPLPAQPNAHRTHVVFAAYGGQ